MGVCCICKRKKKSIALGMGNYDLCNSCNHTKFGLSHELLECLCTLDRILQITKLKLQIYEKSSWWKRLKYRGVKKYLIRQKLYLESVLACYPKCREGFNITYLSFSVNGYNEKEDRNFL